jgi:hypothetical protein
MPTEFELRVEPCPFERETSVTEAPAITAPVLSLTTPRTVPLVTTACAAAIWQVTAKYKKPRGRKRRRMTDSPSMQVKC